MQKTTPTESTSINEFNDIERSIFHSTNALLYVTRKNESRQDERTTERAKSRRGRASIEAASDPFDGTRTASMSQRMAGGSHDNPDRNSRSCRVLSVALSDIIRQSVNVDFRDRCFEVLRTDSSFGARATLAVDLLSIVSHNNRSTHCQGRQAATMENKTTRNARG